MALTATIIKKSVTKTMEKQYNLTVNLLLKSDGVEVINRDFNLEYKTGDNVNKKQVELQKEIQAVIDNYKAEQVLFNHAAFKTMCDNIQSGLTL